MINRDMLQTVIEGGAANILIFISTSVLGDVINMISHILITSGTLFLMYKQYKKLKK